eukprot:scaffold8302_cov20-Tisochrysis_lutea.AAC.4
MTAETGPTAYVCLHLPGLQPKPSRQNSALPGKRCNADCLLCTCLPYLRAPAEAQRTIATALFYTRLPELKAPAPVPGAAAEDGVPHPQPQPVLAGHANGNGLGLQRMHIAITCNQACKGECCRLLNGAVLWAGVGGRTCIMYCLCVAVFCGRLFPPGAFQQPGIGKKCTEDVYGTGLLALGVHAVGVAIDLCFIKLSCRLSPTVWTHAHAHTRTRTHTHSHTHTLTLTHTHSGADQQQHQPRFIGPQLPPNLTPLKPQSSPIATPSCASDSTQQAGMPFIGPQLPSAAAAHANGALAAA